MEFTYDPKSLIIFNKIVTQGLLFLYHFVTVLITWESLVLVCNVLHCVLVPTKRLGKLAFCKKLPLNSLGESSVTYSVTKEDAAVTPAQWNLCFPPKNCGGNLDPGVSADTLLSPIACSLCSIQCDP